MKVVAAIAAVLALSCGLACAAEVGFEQVEIGNGAEPPLTIGIWYPTDAPATPQALGAYTQTVTAGGAVAGRALPLIVMSHGGGGSYDGHYDTALALARGGFVAAALSHAGDDVDDQSKVLQLWRRPAQLRRLVDYMLGEWPQRAHVNRARVGAFGFSNGGFTVVVAAGGVPDLPATATYCAAHPDHDLCQALQHAGVDAHLGADAPADAWRSDPRIKAAVIAAPAFGFAFSAAGLRDVHVPLQLWGAAEDRHQPPAYYEQALRAALPHAPEFHLVANAGHFDFLPPCSAPLARRAPNLCKSLPGFDRGAFHAQFNGEVVRFFQAALR